MKKRLLKTMLLLCALIVGSGSAWGQTSDTYTFSSIYSSVTGSSSSNITSDYGTYSELTYTKGSGNQPKYYANGSAIRLYNGNTLTISAKTNYLITGVTIHHNSSSGGAGNVTISEGSLSGNDYSWSDSDGEASLDFSVSGICRIGSIEVTVKSTSGGGDPTPTTYTVTYNANGGTGTMTDSDSPYDANSTVTVLGNSFTRDGYTFTNWNTAADGSGTDYDEDDTFTITANTTLYAQWNEVLDANTTILTFDVSSNPGEWPTANSTTLTNYTYTLNTVDYTFALNNVKCNSGYLMMTATAALGLPAIEGYKLTKVVAHNSNGCSTSTRVGISSSSSSADYLSGGAAQTWSTTGSSYTYTLSGTSPNTMYYLYVTNKNAQLIQLDLYYEVDNTTPPVATPEISGTENFLTSTEVTITCATDGAAIQYSTDGGNTWTNYTAAFTLTATTTVKAKATKSGMDGSAVAEATFTKITPMTVAEARAAIDANTNVTDAYVTGTVSQVDEYVSNYHSITYWISDDGTTTNQLEVYSGKGINGANFSSIDDIQVGDVVVVKGDLKKHNDDYEFNYNNELVSIITKTEPGLAYATTEYTVAPSASFETPTLTNPHNLTVTYSVSTNDNVASVDASTGAVTVGSNAGTVTITASFAGDATYRAGSASYTLTVKEPNFITLAAGATVTTTSFPSFSGTGYKTLDDYQIVLSSGNAKDWSVTDCMKSGDDLQMKASTGTLVSPAIRTPYGYTVTVNYTSDEAMTLSSGTDTETGANGSVSLDVQSTNAAFTLQAGSRYATVQSITITAKANATITLNAACTDGSMVYGTYSNSSAFVVSDDIVVAEIGFDSNNRLNVVEYATGDVVPANTGVMVSALAGGDYTVNLSSEAGTSKLGTDNRLRPTGNGITDSEMSTADANCLFYRLTMHNGTEIGFWWGAEDGAAFGLAANKAYLAVPSGQASRAMGFSFDSISTSVNGVGTMLDMNAPVYNVLGQRVSPSTKGILIQNGKKFINK